MRWRRGFWRLWLVIAIPWVAVGAYGNFRPSEVYYPELYIGIVRDGTVNAVSPYSDDAKALERLEQSGDLQRQYMTGVYPRAIYFAASRLDAATASDRLERVTAFLETERAKTEVGHRYRQWESFFFLAVLPPALLLLVGMALAWVLQGFRTL